VPDFLFHAANGFYDISLHCARDVTKGKGITSVQRLAPAAVNMCFTAELLIKGLLLLTTNKNLRGHFLTKLYKELPERIKVQIEIRYLYHQDTDKLNKDFGAFKMVISKEKNEKPLNDDDELVSLNKLLSTHDNGFEKWRYPYEINEGSYINEIDFKSMNCFIKAMIDTVNSEKEKTKSHPPK
jgi:hypothetical protein